MRLSAQARNVKAYYPGGVVTAHMDSLALLCVSTPQRWDQLEYIKACKCAPYLKCNRGKYIFYDSNANYNVLLPVSCIVLDGGEFTDPYGFDNTGFDDGVILDGGQEDC